MPSSASVLIYGNDPILIKTRRLVLEKASFRVVTATNLAEAYRILSAETVNVFNLCHTLPANDRDCALSLAHSVQPEVKILVLDGVTSDLAIGTDDTVLSAFTDPRLLISTVQSLTRESGTLPPDLISPHGMSTETASQTQ